MLAPFGDLASNIFPRSSLQSKFGSRVNDRLTSSFGVTSIGVSEPSKIASACSSVQAGTWGGINETWVLGSVP